MASVVEKGHIHVVHQPVAGHSKDQVDKDVEPEDCNPKPQVHKFSHDDDKRDVSVKSVEALSSLVLVLGQTNAQPGASRSKKQKYREQQAFLLGVMLQQVQLREYVDRACPKEREDKKAAGALEY